MSALGDVIVDAAQELLRVLFTPIESVIETHADALVRTVVGTPAPDVVFGRPTNGAWPGLYDYYWEMLLPLALFVWALAIGLVIFFESTSYVFSSYHRSKLKKRAFSGLLGILMWWWIAALSLRFVGALTDVLVPNLGDVALFETLSFSAMGVLGVVIALTMDFVLFVLIAVIYFLRQLVLYLFVLLMPLLIALWIPGVGPFTLVSGLMKRLAKFYVPFLFMTVPAALLFRVGEVVGTNVAFSAGGIGAWITALIIPLVAVASPFVLFWQAGTIFSMTSRVSRHVSGRQAQERATTVQETGASGLNSSRNFARGVRGRGAIEQDGTKHFGAGDSRANRAGLSLRSRAQDASTQLHSRVRSEEASTEQSPEDPTTDESNQPVQQNRHETTRTESTGTARSSGRSSPRSNTERTGTEPEPSDSEQRDSRPSDPELTDTDETDNQTDERTL